MKTFEERYTAWIDGKLEGPALTSFELELSRRASAGEARADKADAAWLHQLLVSHLTAPAMTNAEFFSHQLRERIDAERASGRRREEARQARGSFFSWPFARLAGLTAGCGFVATALYYGMMPPHSATSGPQVAVQALSAQPKMPKVAPTQAAEAIADKQSVHSTNNGEFAFASTPAPVDLNANIQVVKVPGASTDTSATPLHLKDTNANVLWINGLEYMPVVPGESPAASASSAPSGSATP